MVRRKVDVGWECLSRVDTMDAEVAQGMKRAGCIRVFFGIESGNDSVLGLMNKHITTSQAKNAVYAAKAAGLKWELSLSLGTREKATKQCWILCVLPRVCRLIIYRLLCLIRFLEHRSMNGLKTKALR